VRDEIELALLQIAADPVGAGTPLVGRLSGRRRTRVGGYRSVYRIVEGGRLVIVDAISRRADAY
jgi:mRNA-degrading endonuclease RelE of RelBE toxin-antitoxin system